MLEGFNEKEVEYAIFDDIVGGFDSILDYKGWFGGQKEMRMGDKYMHKRHVMWNKPSIFIANIDPRCSVKRIDLKWLNTNCTFVELNGILADVAEHVSNTEVD